MGKKQIQRPRRADGLRVPHDLHRPGQPLAKWFVESFHARFRDECLNQEVLWALTEARVVVEDLILPR